MYCTLTLPHSCTATLFHCDLLYGFIKDKVQEKPLLLPSCVVWSRVCHSLVHKTELLAGTGFAVGFTDASGGGLSPNPAGGYPTGHCKLFIWTLAGRETQLKLFRGEKKGAYCPKSLRS